MVWGMPLPPGPYGEYEGKVDIYGDGWRHRLQAYYHEQLTDKQKAVHEDGQANGAHWYPGNVLHKFIYELGKNDGSPDSPLVTPIEEHEPPRFFQFESGHKSPASIISLPSRILAVSEPMKSFLEWLEPDVHQFFPIEVRNTRGKVYQLDYYVLVIGQYLDSFLPEKSQKDTFRKNGSSIWYSITTGSKKEVTGLALSKSKFDGAHMWRERAFREWLICFSDELMAEILDAGLKMPRQWRMKEV